MQTEAYDIGANRSVPRRRKSYTINKAFQWKFTLLTVGTGFMASGFISIVLFNVLHQQARARAMAPMSAAVTDSLTMVILYAGAFGLVMSLALGITVYVFTHRIAGPVYVIGRGLETLGKGHIPVLRPLRKYDEFKDVYDQLCTTVKRIEREHADHFEQLTELYNLAHAGTVGEASSGSDACKELVKRLDVLRQQALDACGDVQASRLEAVMATQDAPEPAVAAVGGPA